MIRYLEHHIVDHCNLKCAGCSHFSPLCGPWFENIEDFKRDFGKLAELTEGNVGIIRLMGGEPLLHPDLHEFLIACRNLFPNTHIELVTNGILLPSKKDKGLLEVCNDFGIVVCVSDYGLLDVTKVLDGFKLIRFYGKTELYNISMDLSGSQDPKTAFDNCDLHVNRWDYFQHGRFYPCCIGGNIHIFEQHFNLKLLENEDDISISIYKHSLTEIEDFMNRPKQLCKYCQTILRSHNYTPFSRSTGDIKEWTYP